MDDAERILGQLREEPWTPFPGAVNLLSQLDPAGVPVLLAALDDPNTRIRAMITRYSAGSSMRGAPSFTSSAVTPSFRRFTSSMKAGGKLHSRPTIRPTFAILELLVEGVAKSEERRGGAYPLRSSPLATP